MLAINSYFKAKATCVHVKQVQVLQVFSKILNTLANGSQASGKQSLDRISLDIFS